MKSKGLSRVFSNTTVQKHQFFSTQLVQFSHPYMITGKTIALTIWTVVGKVMSLLFNMVSRFAIAFLLRSKCLLMAAISIHHDFGFQENKVCHCFHFSLFPSPPPTVRPPSERGVESPALGKCRAGRAGMRGPGRLGAARPALPAASGLACPGGAWNATPRSLPSLERNIRSRTHGSS